MTNHEKMQELCDQLKSIIESEDNELGEYCQILVEVCRYAYCMTEEFSDAVIREMETQIQPFCVFDDTDPTT